MNVESSNNKAPNYKIDLTFNPEILRIVAYTGLIIMLGVGYVLTKTIVTVHPHDTAIYKLFGFNHSCNVLDHQPSRAVAAMFMPFWEIPFLLYLIFNVLRINDAYRENKVPRYVFLTSVIFFPIQALLTVWFRMVFVENPEETKFIYHYLPYIGFQLLLFMTAFENVLYFRAMDALPFKNNRLLANGYLVVLFGITVLAITFGLSIALGNPIWNTVENPSQRVFFQWLSRIYLILAIIVPFGLSIMELKRSPKHTISFS